MPGFALISDWYTRSANSEANSVNILIHNTASECSEGNSVNIFTDAFVTPVVLQKHQSKINSFIWYIFRVTYSVANCIIDGIILTDYCDSSQ